MEIFLIILSLGLLMFLAFRGVTVLLLAPICALIAASVSGLPIIPVFTELFMIKTAGYFKAFLPIFLLGALFGKLMGDTGMTTSIARKIIVSVGKEQAALAIALAGFILTYGGVSLFVAAFALYPFGSTLFKQANLPKRLLPGTISVGIFASSMGHFPGSPQIQNVIPSVFFGTTGYAAPGIGSLTGAICFIMGVMWIKWRCKQAATMGEGYGNHTLNETVLEETSRPVHWVLALLPMLTVLVLNYIFTKNIEWSPAVFDSFKAMNLPLLSGSIKAVRASWALLIALLFGIALTILIGWRNLGSVGNFIKSMNTATAGAMTAILNTALMVGYGSVLSSLVGFKTISKVLMAIKIGDSPLLSEFVTISLLGGVTGSASGGLSIALQTMGTEWMNWAAAVNISPDILHRIAAIASGGLSSMPHNGAVVTLFVLCGLTHKESYYDIFILCLVKLFTGFVAIALFSMFGLF